MRPMFPAAVAVALSMAAASTPAHAALDAIGPNGPLAFEKQLGVNQVSWTLTGVPDIDQARGTNSAGTKVGLPNGGYMYCVPTTGMDFLAFLADRGFAGSLGVPSKDWTLATNFNEMSVLLAQLGGEMGTDPVKGTGGDGFVAAMTKRLAESEIGAVQVVYYALDSEGGTPTVSDVIDSGADGDLLAAGIGFYKDETVNGKPVKRRTGGHAFAIVGGSGVKGSAAGTVSTRDPATEYVADTVQGAYTTDPHTVSPLSATFVYTDDNGNDQTYDATLGTWDGSTTTLFEGFTRILPKATWIGLGDKLVRAIPEHLVPDPGPLRTIYEVPGDGSVKSLALSALTNAPAFIVNGSDTVYTLDPVSGASRKIASVPGARLLAYGGAGQRLFVAGKRKLVALDRRGAVVRSLALAAPLQALDFDASSGRLAGIAGGRLMLFDSSLHRVASRTLPAVQRGGTPLLAFTPGGRLVTARAGGATVLQSNMHALAARHGRAAADRLPLTARPLAPGSKIRGLAVDDLGQVIVSVGGKVRVLGPGGRPRVGSPFDGLAGDKVLAVTRSFDNTAGSPWLQTLDQTVGPPPAFKDDPPPPPPPAKQPNLVIGELQNSSSIVVRNIGDADAGAFSVSIADPAGGGTQSVRFDAGLAAGAEAAVPRYTCSAGRTFTADSGGEVVESSESDNVHTCP